MFAVLFLFILLLPVCVRGYIGSSSLLFSFIRFKQCESKVCQVVAKFCHLVIRFSCNLRAYVVECLGVFYGCLCVLCQ